MLQIRKILRPFSRRGEQEPTDVVRRANRAAAAHRMPGDHSAAVASGSQGWARPEYGRYMATSPSVYAAVRLRAEAVTRPPLRLYRREALRQAQGERNGMPHGGREYPAHGGGEYPAHGGGEYPAHGGREYPAHGSREYPAHGSREYAAHGSREYPAHDGREYPAHGGREYPAHGGREYPAHGSREYPAHGGGEYPAHGGREYPAHGGREYPARGELVEPHAKDVRRVPVEPSHPAARLLAQVNPWYTRADLWRATEIYLCLWGSAFWAIERGEDGAPELWPLRPDRVAVIPDRQRYVRGFVYRGTVENVAYTPDEMVWLRYFNPLEELAGLSPLAPARLSADMGQEGLRFNRHLLRNSARPDFLLLTNHELNDAELEDFYARWEQRYQGPGNAHRPAIASAVRDVKTLGLSHRDIDFIQGLRWSLEEVSRTYGVPKLLLGDFERATYANVQASERLFWRNTVVPEVRFLEDQMNRALLPRLGYPNLTVEFDLSAIEALQEDEASRVQRETALLDRGVLTINEVRRERNLPEVPWGDGPAGA